MLGNPSGRRDVWPERRENPIDFNRVALGKRSTGLNGGRRRRILASIFFRLSGAESSPVRILCLQCWRSMQGWFPYCLDSFCSVQGTGSKNAKVKYGVRHSTVMMPRIAIQWPGNVHM
jgi:hypothetical protein